MNKYERNPDAYFVNEDFEKFAAKHGWRLDTSPETENSEFVYYWNDSELTLKNQEDLMEYLKYEQ